MFSCIVCQGQRTTTWPLTRWRLATRPDSGPETIRAPGERTEHRIQSLAGGATLEAVALSTLHPGSLGFVRTEAYSGWIRMNAGGIHLNYGKPD